MKAKCFLQNKSLEIAKQNEEDLKEKCCLLFAEITRYYRKEHFQTD